MHPRPSRRPPAALAAARAFAARPRGFTMIELMVTLAIAAILLALAAPAMRNMLASHAVSSQTSELVEAMKFARSEAMKRSAPVTVCKVPTPGSTTCSNANVDTWQYWIVFTEVNKAGNTIGKYDGPPETLLRAQSSSSSTAVWQPPVPADLQFVSFQTNGIAVVNDWGSTSNGGPSTASIAVKPVVGLSTGNRTLCLNSQGRVGVVQGTAACP